MNFRSTVSILALATLSLTAVACAHPADEGGAESAGAFSDAQRIASLGEMDPYNALSTISEVVTATSRDKTVRIISTIGGDPAMNGVFPLLAVDYGDGGDRRVFELDVSTAGVTGAVFQEDGTLDISFQQDTYAEDEVTPIKIDGHFYITDLFTAEGTPKMSIALGEEAPTPEEDLMDTYDERAVAFSDVVAVKHVGDERNTLSFVTLSHPANAWNKGSLYAVVASGYEAVVFDLGVQLGELTSAELTASGDAVNLEGTEHTSLADDETELRPFHARFGFSATEDALSSEATFTRN